MKKTEMLMDEIGAKNFFCIGRKNFLFGEAENPEEVLEAISIVLKQAIESLKDVPIREIKIEGEDQYILIILKGKEIVGFLLPQNKNEDDVLRIFHSKEQEIFEELFPSIKPEVKEKEPEKAKKEPEVKIEEKIEISEVKVEKIVYEPEILDKIREITAETLGDFTTEIFENIIQDLSLNKEKIDRDKLMELINELEKSAKMIVGPTKAGNMKDDILKILKEV